MAALHLSELFRRLAERGGERTSLVDQDGREWSAAALVERIWRAGNALLGLGLRPGDRVAILQDDCRQYLEADYGTMSAGLVRVPLDPRLSAEELAAQLADSGARALVAGRAQLERLPARPAAEVVVCDAYEELLARAAPTPPEGRDPDEPASLNYTGGTTDRPKAVQLSHRNLAAALGHIWLARPAGPQDTFLNVRPLWPISGIIVLLHLVAGSRVVLGGRFEPEAFGELCARLRPTAGCLVPTQLVRLLEHGVAGERLASLRSIDVGGSAVPPDAFREALARFGPRFGVIYGLTEAPWSCYLPPHELAGGRLIGAAGREVFGCRVVIRDEAGRPAPEGEVTLRGEHVTRGYWRRPDATAEALREGWLYTGDLGRLDGEGYLHVVGRRKEIIRSGGKTILPQEVEQALLSHPGVAEAAVVGVPDREWGEVVKAFVVLRPGRQVGAAELVEHCRARLSSFKKPRLIELVPELPHSHYGKVRRAELRRLP